MNIVLVSSFDKCIAINPLVITDLTIKLATEFVVSIFQYET